MSVKLGNTAISKLYLGSTEVTKAYLGATDVFSSVVPNGLLNGLVSYYKADTNGSFPDAHGSNDGTINGATYTASGKINGGYSFDGVNDYINLNNVIISGTTNFTIAVWYKTTQTTQGHLYGNNNGQSGRFNLYIIGGLLNFFCNSGTSYVVEDSVTSNDNNWHLALIERDGNTLNLYRDNALVDSVSSISFSIDSTNQRLGGNFSGSLSYDGELDEIPIYNRALSASEKTALYNSGAGLSYDNFTT